MPLVAGLDGCGAKWVFVELDTHTRELRAGLVGTEELPDRCWEPFTIDVPIGLSDSGTREADRLARARLGRRHCTVFNPPIQPALDASTQKEASAITRAVIGKGVGIQSFAIFPKVSAVRALVRQAPAFAARVHEFHPELTFAEWAGAPIPHKKKSLPGRAARQALIAAVFGATAFDQLRRKLR